MHAPSATSSHFRDWNPKDVSSGASIINRQHINTSSPAVRGNRPRTRGGGTNRNSLTPTSHAVEIHDSTRQKSAKGDASCLCGLGFDGVEFVITCHICHGTHNPEVSDVVE